MKVLGDYSHLDSAALSCEQRLLIEYLRDLSLEVIGLMDESRADDRPRLRQLRPRNDPQYFSNALKYIYGLAHRACDGDKSLLQRLHAWKPTGRRGVQVFKVDSPFVNADSGGYPLELVFHPFLSPGERFRWLADQLSIDAGVASQQVGRNVRITLFGGGNSFELFGDEELMEAMKFATENYNVNDRRVVLSGISDGASYALEFALRYPDRVSCVDLRSGGYRSRVFGTPLTVEEATALEVMYGVEARLSRLRHVSGRVAAGELDPHYVGRMARVASEMLVRGVGIEPQVVLGVGHEFSLPPVRVREAPVMKAGTLENGILRPYPSRPVSVEQLCRFMDEWSVHYEFSAGAELRVWTKNVARLVVSLPKIGNGHYKLIIDGASVGEVSSDGKDNRLLRSGDGVWHRWEGGLREKEKHSVRYGPISAARTYGITIVLGTMDPQVAPFLEARAEKILRKLCGWRPGQDAGAMPRVIKDTEITRNELSSGSFWLLGTPSQNAAFAKLGLKPKAIIEEATLNIGDVRIVDKDMLLEFVAPHPISERDYLIIDMASNAASYGGPILDSEQFDYVVNHVDFCENKIQMRGYWDNKWEYDNALSFWH